MTKIISWIVAFRLRTLPLAISSILMGSFLAIASGNYNWAIIWLSIVTTLFLQILSNLANDYGDGIKGTDNEERLGPKRTIQSGEISPKEMKAGIIVFVLLSLISGIWLIFESLGSNWPLGLLFFTLGIAAIAAAIVYTVGTKAYGYSGFGDLFVFLFFGLLAVMGTYFLNTYDINWEILLPASSMGLLSTGVLNLNNMRDMENDAKSGKKTMALILGYKFAKIYHTILITMAMIFVVVFVALQYHCPWQFIFIICFPFLINDLIKINKITDKSLLDPYLKKLALATLLFTFLFGIGIIFG
ncbi:MAG: 1,4-dihydroxy-2-naphthoate polyprenyltransferase [Bacteroidetes bacterium]|nr:1,4-dihydroxy-2-naphthoate polyprenyltransferase [Bacteroidota bacterium]MBL6944755.1 1,4-dihydroxy-2-naphthoate polyprenyltransferase [Bacteroidales bacterium]